MARRTSRTNPNRIHQPPRGADFERAHSIVVLSEDVRDRRRGFTIVELLIVVVVIAILAAITIVAYNGITSRSKASAAATSAEQAAKKVMAYAITNSDQYPATLSDAGVISGSASYQYRVDNSANPKTFCLTATTQNVSYWVSSSAATPAAGACAGHGVNGAGTITNLYTTPSLTSTSGYWTNYGTGGVGSVTTSTDGGAQGPSYLRLRWTTAPTAGSLGTGTNTTMPVTGGRSYSFSAYVRTSWATSVRLNVGFQDAAATQTNFNSSSTAVTAGSWTRLTYTATASAGAVAAVVYPSVPSGATLPPVNATLDVDGFMFVDAASTPPYSDGDSANWVWDGTPNNSTSTGPAS